MRFAFYTNSFSPHQLPLAKALMDILGKDDYRYISAHPVSDERKQIGWGNDVDAEWYVKEWEDRDTARKILETADVVMSGIRDIPLMAYRCKCGLRTIYCSERWFKPCIGMLRMLRPSYFMMAWSFAKLLRNSNAICYFPIGIHAARDMARLCGLLNGDVRCLFRVPELGFDRRSGGKIWLEGGGNSKKYCLDKMLMWGYYVEPSRYGIHKVQEVGRIKPREIKVLWVGRLLKLKRVDTIVRAVGEHSKLKRVDDSLPVITLDIYGAGPEENRLRNMAAKYGDCIKFYPPVPIAEVRELMRGHDVYVLSSNGYEGWGAVVSESLEEGMKVIGTYEAGSTATMLPESNLFHVGDWKRLLQLISRPTMDTQIDQWSAKSAVKVLVGDDIHRL